MILYIRMIIVMIINLYTVRLVIQTLGDLDYGIFTVIAGVVIMFQSVSSVLSTSTQRFYSYYIGEQREREIIHIFSASLNIFIIYAFVILLLSETIGLWFINNCLNIPLNRMVAANWLYQFSILAFIATILQTPYSSAVIAYENMNIFAVISLSECFLKLIAIIAISIYSRYQLVLYGASLLIVPVISLISYYSICKKKYNGCSYIRKPKNRLYKELLSFSGWHLFSSFASVGMNQINTILVNIFFGLIVNAARGIALQLTNALSSFSGSFIMAVRPPLIKAYAEKDYPTLNKLFNYSNKFIFYLMLLIILPLYIGIAPILDLWIGESSEEMIQFCRLCLIYSFILSLNNPISIIVQATGKIKNYFIYVEVFTLLCPLATYFLFKVGFPASSTFYAMIISIICSHFVRLICLKRVYPLFEVKTYCISFLLRAIIVTLLTIVSVLIFKYFILSNVWYDMFFSILTAIVFTLSIGLNAKERNILDQNVRRLIQKLSFK